MTTKKSVNIEEKTKFVTKPFEKFRDLKIY